MFNQFEKKTYFYECSQCSHLLVDPVTIACGNSVCKTHLDEMMEGLTREDIRYECKICNKKHRIPEEGFVVNKHIQSALDIRDSSSYLSPLYEECNKEIEEARNNVENIELLQRNSESYIYEYFEEIKRQIDLRREDLKAKIDTYSDKIIRDVDNAKMNCIRLAKKINISSLQADKSQVTQLFERLNKFGIDHQTFYDVQQEIARLNKKFTKIIDEFNDDLIGNRKYSFDFKDLPFEDIFGCFRITEKYKFDSAILGADLQTQLLNLYEFPSDQKLELQYRATRDGFEASDFHRRCDGLCNTLTIIKTSSGNVFGGFTERSWNSGRGKILNDRNASIFSLINKDNNPFKVMCSNNGYGAIYCSSTFGPVFGVNHQPELAEIVIRSNSNSGEVNYSLFGFSYKHPDYPAGTAKACSILAGSGLFQIVDIEVFTKIN